MVPYGPISDEKWSRTHIYRDKKVMVPWVVRNGPNSYLNVDTIDPVDRSRSISTVDKDSPTGESGRYRRSMPILLRRITVDRRWSIKNRDNFVIDFIDDTCGNLLSWGQGEVGTSAISDRGCISLGSLTMKPRDRT